MRVATGKQGEILTGQTEVRWDEQRANQIAIPTFWLLTLQFLICALAFLGPFLCEPRGSIDRSGCRLEAAFAFLHVLLWVEDDDVDLGDIEHPEGNEGAQAHGDGQRCRLNVYLGRRATARWSQRLQKAFSLSVQPFRICSVGSSSIVYPRLYHCGEVGGLKKLSVHRKLA